MSKNNRTIQIHLNNPAQAGLDLTHTYEGVRVVDMEHGLHLWGEDDQLIASYQDHAWNSWNVVPDKPKSTGDHLHFSGHVSGMTEEEFAERMAERKKRSERLPFTGVDVEDGKGAPITTKIDQPRDHLGRFVKRN